MGTINKLQETEKKLKPGPKMRPPGVRNKGLEQAIAEAGSIDELARRVELSPGAVRSARAGGMTPGLALLLWDRCRIKISKLLGRSVLCPHCQKEI
jgi:hypothetical protein